MYKFNICWTREEGDGERERDKYLAQEPSNSNLYTFSCGFLINLHCLLERWEGASYQILGTNFLNITGTMGFSTYLYIFLLGFNLTHFVSSILGKINPEHITCPPPEDKSRPP